MVRSLIPSVKDYTDRILRADDQISVLREALLYYDTVDLWCLNAEITGDPSLGKVRTKFDIARSHIFWNKFIAPNAQPEDFIDRLRVPHAEIDETVQLYKHKFGDLNQDAQTALREGKKSMEVRRSWELKLLQPTVEAFLDYLKWEEMPDLKHMLFNRAVSAFPQSYVLWQKWIQYTWDKDPHIVERATKLCDCPAIHTTRLLLGLDSSIQTQEHKLAHLCYLISRLYECPREEAKLVETASQYVKASRDPEFIGYVLSMILVVDRAAAEGLWVLKSDAMYNEWFQWVRLSLIPDITTYFEYFLDLEQSSLVILKEQLRAFLVLGIPQRADDALMRLRSMVKTDPSNDSSEATNKNTTELPLASSEPVRNRENTSFIISGPATKTQIYDKLDKNKIVSSQHTNDHHILEMASEQDKNVAIATLSFRQKIPGTSVYDAKETTLWVTKYDAGWSKPQIEELFSRFGTVLAIRTPQTQGRRFCYVQYATAQEALHAIETVSQAHPDIIVKLSDPKARKPRTGAVEEGRLVYVSGLDFETPKNQLTAWLTTHSLFSPEEVTIPSSASRKREHDGYAFVEFSSSEQAQKAVSHFNTLDHAGRPVRANISRKKRRLENPHYLTVENVYDEGELRELVNGEIKYNEQTHVAQLLFESEKDVGRAMLKISGKEIAGHTLKIKTDIKPKSLK